jgi:hypothetical protein
MTKGKYEKLLQAKDASGMLSADVLSAIRSFITNSTTAQNTLTGSKQATVKINKAVTGKINKRLGIIVNTPK